MELSRNHIIINIINAIMEGSPDKAVHLIELGFKKGMSSEELLEEALIPATRRLSDIFRGANFNIPDVLLSSRAIKAATYTLKPYSPDRSTSYQIIIGTVEGDIHDIGKNMVTMFFELSGLKVLDLGVNITPGQFMQAVNSYHPNILAMSALLTTTMVSMTETIDILIQHKIRDQVKVMIGGGPVTKEFAASIGADGWADNTTDALKCAQKFVSKKNFKF